MTGKTAALLQRYPALQRPLVFGDPEQIEALEQIERKIAEAEEIDMLVNHDGNEELPEEFKPFDVTVLVRSEEALLIYARDKWQAWEVAERVAVLEFGDDAEVDGIREVTS